MSLTFDLVQVLLRFSSEALSSLASRHILGAVAVGVSLLGFVFTHDVHDFGGDSA
jgi:hypothetical protein